MIVEPAPQHGPDVEGTTTGKVHDARTSLQRQHASPHGFRPAQDCSYIGMISQSASMAAAARSSAAASHAGPRRVASSSEKSSPSLSFVRPSAPVYVTSASPPLTQAARATVVARRIGDRISLMVSRSPTAGAGRQGTTPSGSLAEWRSGTAQQGSAAKYPLLERLEKRSSRSSLGTPPTSGASFSGGISSNCEAAGSSASNAVSGPCCASPSPHQQQHRTSRPSRLVSVSFREDSTFSPAGRSSPQGLDSFHRPDRGSAVRRTSVPFGFARPEQALGCLGEELSGGMKRSASHSATLSMLQQDDTMLFL